jgi:hypothetical protein
MLLSIAVALIYIFTKSVEVFLFPPHPNQHLLLFVLLMISILIGVRWNLNVVLICIFFMAQDGENFFIVYGPFVLLP